MKPTVKYVTVFRSRQRSGITPAQYNDHINSLGPLAHWALGEGSGSVAVDETGNYNGTHNNITWDDDGWLSTPAPIFNGNNSRVATYSAGLAGALDMQEFSIGCWLKVDSIADWSDGVLRIVYDIFSDASNRALTSKRAQNDGFFQSHTAGGTTRSLLSNITYTRWFHWFMTASTSNTRTRFYLDGVLANTVGAPGTYAGAINSASMAIGNFFTSSTNIGWKGNIRHFMLYDRELTQAEVASLVPANLVSQLAA